MLQRRGRCIALSFYLRKQPQRRMIFAHVCVHTWEKESTQGRNEERTQERKKESIHGRRKAYKEGKRKKTEQANPPNPTVDFRMAEIT